MARGAKRRLGSDKLPSGSRDRLTEKPVAKRLGSDKLPSGSFTEGWFRTSGRYGLSERTGLCPNLDKGGPGGDG